METECRLTAMVHFGAFKVILRLNVNLNCGLVPIVVWKNPIHLILSKISEISTAQGIFTQVKNLNAMKG